MNRVISNFEPGTEFCHGGARGADTIAGDVCEVFGYLCKSYPVDTRIDGPWPGAGMNRNRRMFDDFKPDLVIAFPMPQSRGTIGMINYAKSKGCPVTTYAPV